MFEPAPAWLTSCPGVFLVSWLLHVSSTLSFACSWDWLLDKFRPKGVNSLSLAPQSFPSQLSQLVSRTSGL
ncbi:hypothetical protein CPAR01_10940 [Colletotrichum paranaense]|uniref:Secreted protein n=1 Tax=Colletotrichum paranaense TaxID=1914294 RepID=A0ABQ9SA71_9PEZI|nr:uncharacterized protein CPAR01_10940 [Colletotrichum paranaense]KAK1531291.1 hypothetical protein CPAR01_10940 [Colletotrichum paranaense]